MRGPDEANSSQQDLQSDDEQRIENTTESATSQTSESAEELPEEEGPREEDEIQADSGVPEWLQADLSDEVAEDKDVPGWLTSELGGADVPTETGETFDPEATIVSPSRFTPPAEEVPKWLKDEVSAASEPGPELSDDQELSWLDQIAAGQGAAIEELPTLSWDDDQEEQIAKSAGATGEEPAAIMEAGTGDQETVGPVVGESEVEGTGDSAKEVKRTHAEPGTTGTDLEDTLVGHPPVPEDPDEAMAWLEQLAARQGASADELTTAISQTAPLSDFDPEMLRAQSERRTEEERTEQSAAEPESSLYLESDLPVGAGDIPEDPDEAMAWLEHMSSEHDALSEPMRPQTEEKDAEDELAKDVVDEELASVMAELGDIELPVDSAQALAWLEEMRFGSDSPEESEMLAVDEVQTPATEQDIVEERVEAELLLTQSEEDISALVEESEDEDALAWLEQLAASEGELEEELTSVDAADAEAISSGQLADEEGQPADAGVATEQVVELPEVGEVEPVVPEEPAGVEAIEGEPPWLSAELADATGDEGLEWLDSLNELDAASWLQSEAEAAVKDLSLPEAELVAASEVDEDREVPTELQEVAADELMADMAESATPDNEQLVLARSALDAGDFEAAADAYGELLESVEGLPFLIADLESTIERHSEQSLLQRVLGDAYLRDGQLQKAVDVYRQALDNL